MFMACFYLIVLNLSLPTPSMSELGNMKSEMRGREKWKGLKVKAQGKVNVIENVREYGFTKTKKRTGTENTLSRYTGT